MSIFLGVFGAVDCRHIPIVSSGGISVERFRCQKGYFSLNVQTLSYTNLKAVLEPNTPFSYHVLGHNGYGCRSYILTPFLDPMTDGQNRYNAAHNIAQNTMEQQYDVWKRFPCLATPLRCSSENALIIIVGTAVLHNIAEMMNDNLFEENQLQNDSNTNFNFSAAGSSSSLLEWPKKISIVNTFL